MLRVWEVVPMLIPDVLLRLLLLVLMLADEGACSDQPKS